MTRGELAEGIDPAELVVRCALAGSKAEARRFVDQGGVYVNNVRIEASTVVDLTATLHDRYLVVRRGRRHLHLVVVE